MDRLPMEIYDHITSYVEGISHKPYDSPYYLAYKWHYLLPYGIPKDKGKKNLAILRQVNKAFCRSASRLLFRSVICWLDRKRSIRKIEELSLSEYATYVREIDFDRKGFTESFSKRELREDQCNPFSRYVTDTIPSLLTRFLNLESVLVYDCGLGLSETLTFDILKSIANLQSHNVTRLCLPADATEFLASYIISSNTDAPVTQLVQAIQHLSIDKCGQEDDYLDDLDILLRTATNLRSLEVNGFVQIDSPLLDFGLSERLQLKYLVLRRVYISAYDLLNLLEWCKETIEFVTIDFVALTRGSWLHVLVQINKNLKLFTFSLFDWELYVDYETDEYYETGLKAYTWQNYGRFQEQHELICHALGDLQRQINANRVAAGLEPWPKSMARELGGLDLPPLESALEEAQYEELIARSWDSEEDVRFYDGLW